MSKFDNLKKKSINETLADCYEVEILNLQSYSTFAETAKCLDLLRKNIMRYKGKNLTIVMIIK